MARDTLTLMRHAKSDWKHGNLSDHERPLNARGRRDAPDMASRLKTLDIVPQLILCSTALRTRETADLLLEVFDSPSIDIRYKPELYLASSETLLASLDEVTDNINHVMIIAHNPGMEDLSATLSGLHTDIMQTAAIRQFTCPRIADIRSTVREKPLAHENDIRLEFSDYPKSISENPANSANA